MTYLDVEVADAVAVLTLDDPPRRNALNLTLVDEIVAALDHADVLVAGIGTGGTLMGVGRRVREAQIVPSGAAARLRHSRARACSRS